MEFLKSHNLNTRSLTNDRRTHLNRLMSFTNLDEIAKDTHSTQALAAPTISEYTKFERIPTQTNFDHMQEQANHPKVSNSEEKELLFTSSYEDYVEQFIQKLDLLISLNKPWDHLDLSDEYDSGKDEQLEAGRTQILASLKRNASVIIEEKGVIPESREELILACIQKFLLVSSTVTCKHLTESLERRTENAMMKCQVFQEALQFMSQLKDFPQASRLFLLGLIHEMTVFASLYEGGYHDGLRQREGSYGMDYLENCEGASHQVMNNLMQALTAFCEALKQRFRQCVEKLQWRLGTTIIWFLTTVSSPKLPFFAYDIQMLPFLQECSWRLSKWYEMTNDYSKDILVSPGRFWDSLSERGISVSQSHFHRMLNDIQENWEYCNLQTAAIPGIFPQSVMALANSMRLAYTLTLIQFFTDYQVNSRKSPAQNADTLYNWTLTDVSNLFVRISPRYLAYSRSLFKTFMGYLAQQQRVLKERCDDWQPFAPISYNNNECAGNPYCCVKVVDEKNIMRGMIATDMLISAGEGLIASYLALTLFISRSRLSLIIPWKQYSDMLWKMLYFSPRHQKLTMMLFQYIIPKTDYIPPVFHEMSKEQFRQVQQGTVNADSIMKNPMLKAPIFEPTDTPSEEMREAFVYFLLHLASHSDGCPGALVGERTSCALCCTFFPFIYNLLCPSSPAYSIPNRDAYIEEVIISRENIFVSTCQMNIRPDGHTAAFCSLVFAEEVVYLIRCMMKSEVWADVMTKVFHSILDGTAMEQEDLQNPDQSRSARNGFHVVLRSQTPWFCMTTAVLKVLGAITPRMYAGSRIRIHEYLMDGDNDVSTLIRAAYHSHGTGTIIKSNRSMGESLVLMDKRDTPRNINNYLFDVVDRVEPPKDRNGMFKKVMKCIERILNHLEIEEELFTLPAPEMPFFNTTDLYMTPGQLQAIILYLYCVRCINHLIINNEELVMELSPKTAQQLWKTALRPLPCNISFNTLIVRQYFNMFIEYLIDTYTGSARLVPMELQTEEDGEIVHGRDKVDPRFGFGKEEEEEVRFDEGEESDFPKVVRNEKRLKKAQEIAAICHVDVMVSYAVLQVC